MRDYTQFYLDGTWTAPESATTLEVIDPATEEASGVIALGTAGDVDRAVAAARAAFPAFAATGREERLALFGRIAEAYQARYSDLAAAVTAEMGAPAWLAQKAQAALGLAHLNTTAEILKTYPFEQVQGTTLIAREPIGVCGFITPWNWPINQIMCKVAPALAAGCTMVLKPSEVAPYSAYILAEVLDAAGVPKGVFNLVNGDGPVVGAALSAHPDIDLISFTGSTRAGIEVARAAAPTVKRVAQELGGKSANIILDDADLEKAVAGGVQACFLNSGQSCNAPTRMLVAAGQHDAAVAIAKAAAEATTVAPPDAEAMGIGPVVSEIQFNKIQELIEKGIDEGADLVAGGLGRPDGMNRGFYVRPTVFAGVDNAMTIAREEIFGPVLCVMPYDDEADAIRIANDTPYGLSGYVQSANIERARAAAAQIRAGNVHINGAGPDFAAPFGGYKQSGNGREWGVFGFEEFLEVKAVMGYGAG